MAIVYYDKISLAKKTVVDDEVIINDEKEF